MPSLMPQQSYTRDGPDGCDPGEGPEAGRGGLAAGVHYSRLRSWKVLDQDSWNAVLCRPRHCGSVSLMSAPISPRRYEPLSCITSCRLKNCALQTITATRNRSGGVPYRSDSSIYNYTLLLSCYLGCYCCENAGQNQQAWDQRVAHKIRSPRKKAWALACRHGPTGPTGPTGSWTPHVNRL